MNDLLFNFYNTLESITIVHIDINEVNARYVFKCILNITKCNTLHEHVRNFIRMRMRMHMHVRMCACVYVYIVYLQNVCHESLV